MRVCVDMDPGESEFVNATSLCSEAEARIAGSKALWLRRQMFLLINVADERELYLGSGLYSQRRTVPGRNQPSVRGSFQAPGLLSSGRGGS